MKINGAASLLSLLFFSFVLTTSSVIIQESCSTKGCKLCVPTAGSSKGLVECSKCLGGGPLCKASECMCARHDCSDAVSKDRRTSNRSCRRLCTVDGHHSQTFSRKCYLEPYAFDKVSQNVHLHHSSCFSQWIHGYSDDGAYKRGGDSSVQVGAITFKAHSPAECQGRCQDAGDCVWWNWRVWKNQDTQSHVLHSCVLKTSRIVEKATSIKLGNDAAAFSKWPSTAEEYKWCNMGMVYNCNGHGYECARCRHAKRCIWKSKHHITGPKYCGRKTDVCSIQERKDEE